MAKPYREGAGWCVRQRYLGQDIYLSGLPTQAAATKAARLEMSAIDRLGKAQGLGPHRTTLGQALQDYAVEHLQRLKGAPQEARRLNKYLLGAHLALVEVSPAPAPSKFPFEVKLGSRGEDRLIPNGLGGYRKALLTKTAGSDELRRVLAQTTVADVSRIDVQRFMDALSRDGLSAASVGLERAVLRGFFNHARKKWKWSQPAENPAAELTLPTVDNERERVLSLAEQELLDSALDDARNEQLKHVVVLLRETAMRASEPLLHATWGSVSWERNVLCLSDGKTGKRDVPLSPVALEALRALRPGKPGERIVALSYEALKAGVRRACERAGVKNLHIHDLRHTAATRLGLNTGNVFLVKALTGHKDLKMVQRYVNVTADDVAAVMHDKSPSASPSTRAPAGLEGGSPAVALETQNLFSAEQVQAMVAKAVSDAMAAVAEARVPVPAPMQVASPSTSSNVLQFRRAV